MCTRCDVVVLLLVAAFVVLAGGAVGQVSQEEAFRQTCSRNLSTLGRAMLIYSSDYQDALPKAGGVINTWVPTLPDWRAPDRASAYALTRVRRDQATPLAARITTTSCLYLLVKYTEVPPQKFVCPSEPGTHEFTLGEAREQLPGGYELIDAWDFGGRYDDRHNPSRHCSYAYHMPFDRAALTVANEPGMAVAADRNPWMEPKRARHPTEGWAAFRARAATDPAAVRFGNSDAHQREGQTVLFLDTHVGLQKRATCGVERDNIYTIAPGKSEAAGEREPAPRVYDEARPAHRTDSVLVQEVPFVLQEPAAGEKTKAAD
ncbi:MAG: hypothetical protein MUC88_24390 [Planctomycetes bacterium]|nr:hypothetical protein [Planctomycetota bacterium]